MAKVLAVVILVSAVVLAGGWCLSMAWNVVMPEVFNAPRITTCQAILLAFVGSMCTGGIKIKSS